jgi:MscS family membrane protein
VLRLLTRLAKAGIAIVGVLILLYMAGMNLTAVLAGLGVGGLAVAFAAQKTLENLLGGIMVISDRPIRVGDICRAGDYTGTVEDIGLRSTRIRTLDRTVVSVPNGQVAALSLENFSLRDKFWFRHNLRLRGETAADQLRYVLAEVRRLLYEHPKVETHSSRARLIGFKEGTLEIEVFAYILTASYDIFLAIQEDLLLRLMDIIEGSGTGVANSVQTMYIARGGGLDAEKSREAVERVRNWRDQGELPFPNFSPDKIAQMKDRLPYPPPGSSQPNPEE